MSRIVVQHSSAFARSKVGESAADASQADDAELFWLAFEKFISESVNQALGKEWAANFQFHRRPGPREHGKWRRLLLKYKHAERGLFDTAHRVALQQFPRRRGDTRAAVIENEDAFDATAGEFFSGKLPELFCVLLKVFIEPSRLRRGRLDNRDASLPECFDYLTIV